MILPDLLQPGLDLIVCGTAAGNKSARHEAYYAGSGNLFYQTLARCNFTAKQLLPNEYPQLLQYKIGLTDLAKFKFGTDKELTREDYDVQSFIDKIMLHKPRFICFNGKTAASVVLGIQKTKELGYGLQNKKIGNTSIFIAPSTSPRAYAFWDESHWAQLKTLIKQQ